MKRSDAANPHEERAERAQLADVILQRRRRPMVERIAACGVAVEEIEHAAHHRLQRNLAVRRGFRHGLHQTHDPVANAGRLFGLGLRIGAIVIRRVRVGGTRFVALVQTSEGEADTSPVPSRLAHARADERPAPR